MRYIAHLDMDAFYASVELLRYPQLRGKPVVIGGRRRRAPNLFGDVTPGDARAHDTVARDRPAGVSEGASRGGTGAPNLFGDVTPGDARAHDTVARDRPADVSEGAAIPTLREYSGRGVITTATYEARKFGLHSGMGLMKAAKLAPDALLLPADFDEYRRYSRLFKDAVRALAPEIEDRGIDEIYVDLTALVESSAGEGAPDPWARARVAALDIQRAVRDATGLSCSIGITPNKLLSKIASELDKPGGLTVLTAADIATRVWPLPVRKINGIGPKAAARLEEMGIRTVGELAQAEPGRLVERFGRSYGAWMHEAAHGRDERAVVTRSEPKSISRETTFEDDLHAVRDRERLSRIFTELCVRLAADLARKGYVGKTIGLKLRYDNFKTVTRDRTLDAPTGDAAAIRRAAGECLKRVPLDRRIRLLGVRVGSLSVARADSKLFE